MIYIIIIVYFSQLPIICGPPHTAAAMFCCISFLDISSEGKFVKYYPQKFTLIYYWHFYTIEFQAGVIMQFLFIYYFLYKKRTHFVFISENLKSFTVAHLLI